MSRVVTGVRVKLERSERRVEDERMRDFQCDSDTEERDTSCEVCAF